MQNLKRLQILGGMENKRRPERLGVWGENEMRSVLRGREPFETPIFNDWGWFQSSKARQELQVVGLADLGADVTKDTLGRFVLGQTHQNI